MFFLNKKTIKNILIFNQNKMGDDIDCCRRPANLGKKDIKTYRGINQKNNPKMPSLNSDDFDNFGTFKPQKNSSNKNGKSRFNSIYGKDKDSKFPNFSDFDIEPVSEPLHQENISQPQPQYENAQYVESTPSNLNQNQIIQDTTNYNTSNLNQNQIIPDTTNCNASNLSQNNVIEDTTNYINPSNFQQDTTNYISPTNYQQNQIIQDTNQYINTTEKYIKPQPQPQIITQNQFQTEFDTTKINSYDTNIQTNYINSNTQDYNINYNTQPVEYINSNPSENIENITSDQYGNSQKVLPTKYIQIQRPAIYADNTQNHTPVSTYIESSSNIQSYQQYSNIPEISSTNNIEYNISPIANTLPQYYESNNEVSYLPPKIETVYAPSNPTQFSQTAEIQYSNVPSNINYTEQPQQVYQAQKPKQVFVQERSNQIYIAKGPNDNENKNKKPKKMKKKTKIIEYYSEDDEEEEHEEENNEEPSQSLYEEIKEQKSKNKKNKTKNNYKKQSEEDRYVKRPNKNVRKQKIYSIEDKENESDNIDSEKNIRRNHNNQNKIIPKNINKRKITESQRDEDEFSDFQKEPEMIRESIENSSNNFNSVYEDRINDESSIKFNNKVNKKQMISLKDGNKISGNFKEEEILDKNEVAEKEREDLFKGQTLKAASVEKKQESTGCQVPGFISNIFNKIF